MAAASWQQESVVILKNLMELLKGYYFMLPVDN